MARRLGLVLAVLACLSPSSLLALQMPSHGNAVSGLRNSHPIVPLFSQDDFPSYMERSAVKRTMLMRVDVFPNGSPQDCEIEISSGDPALDRYTCQLVIGRGHFSSATWTDGQVVTGVIRLPVIWAYTLDGPWGTIHGDLDVTVNHLPQGSNSPVTVQVVLAVDEAGGIQACAEDVDDPKPDKRTPQFIQLACDQLVKDYTPRPPRVEGRPVRSVQTATVRFSSQRR